jgi:hypothetical protein
MAMSVWEWVRSNKFLTLSVIIVIILTHAYFRSNTPASYDTVARSSAAGSSMGKTAQYAPTAVTDSMGIVPPMSEAAPQPEAGNRLVVRESNLSLLVKNVVETRNKILVYTRQAGGYMISANTSNPQDAPTASVDIRIPAEKLDGALEYFHSLSVKVVSENLSGYDVTDEYIDVEKRIGYLQQTIDQYQTILSTAKEVSDITNLTQQIIYTQQQIDQLKGQQEAMSQKSKLARLTVYLSTDELGLPYTPSETWRPSVIFKQAVRAVVADLRKIGAFIIWLAVYGIFWIPVLFLILVAKKYLVRK